MQYADLNLKFGSERAIEFNFAPRDRNWSCLKNSQQSESHRAEEYTDRSEPEQNQAHQELTDEERKELMSQKKLLEL